MEKVIKYENLKRFAYTNEKYCKMPIKGVVVFFQGANGYFTSVNDELPIDKTYGEEGILRVMPHYNPWCFMNKEAQDLTNQVLDVLFEHYGLSDDTPLVYSGASMGGGAALLISALGKHKPVACLANCPLCDMVYQAENEDFTRMIYSAVYHENGTMEEAVKTISPLHNIDKLPKCKYYIFHCDKDEVLDIHAHSDVMVEKMKEHGLDVTYYIVHDMGHIKLTPEMSEVYSSYIHNSINGVDMCD